MKRWLSHLHERDRFLAEQVVDQTRKAFAAGFKEATDRSPAYEFEATVPKAVKWEGSQIAVQIKLRDGHCHLRTPIRKSVRNTFTLAGASVDCSTEGTSAQQIILDTLGEWRERLSSADTVASTGEAEALRSDLATVLLGAAERFGRPWKRATLDSGSHGRHMIQLFLVGRRRGQALLFKTAPNSMGGGEISKPLIDALEAVIGDCVHLSESHARGPDDMPGIMIGAMPRVTVINSDDPIEKMRGIKLLPHGADLIPAVKQ